MTGGIHIGRVHLLRLSWTICSNMLEVANLMYFDGLKENAKTNKYMLSYKYKKYNKLSNIQIKNILI